MIPNRLDMLTMWLPGLATSVGRRQWTSATGAGVHRRRARILVTPEAVVGDLAARLAPVRHAGLLDGVTQAMGRVTGLR